jgi:hypothetical protein
VTQFDSSSEAAKPSLPSVTNPPARVHLGLVAVVVGLIVAFFAVVGLVLYFQPGSSSEPVGVPSLDVFAAGPTKEFVPGTVTYFEKEHVYLVRFSDGAFLALYDLASTTQAEVAAGDLSKLDCRVKLVEGDEVEKRPGVTPAGRGLGTTGFVDPCSDATWDAEGVSMDTTVPASLDRFPVAVIDDIVRIQLAERRCMSQTSSAACIPTQ